MIVKCKICDIQLTNQLIELFDKEQLSKTDNEDFIQKGYFFKSDGKIYRGKKGQIIINIADLINSKNHSNTSRLNGCCGLDGCDGLNKICKNGHEIATEISDCWTSHSVIFEMNLIKIFDK